MLAQLTDDFAALLIAGTFGGGWDRGGWPASGAALDAYAGWQLRHGDSDAERRFGGQVRPARPPGDPAPAQPVAVLQNHLNHLGFTVTDPVGRFGDATEAALREFQHAAYHRHVAVRPPGAAAAPTRRRAPRRYLGAAHGWLDEETARTLDTWRRPAAYGVENADRFIRPDLAQLPAATVFERVGEELYPWPTLVQARAALGLDRAGWRRVGDAQKALWRHRLVARTGFAGPDHTDPPYALHDPGNLFELEALTEFYLNYNDPWLPRSAVEAVGRNVPRAPGTAGYAVVDLLDPAGPTATAMPPHPANRTRLRLDGDLDFYELWPNDAETNVNAHRDLIWLAAPAAGQRRWFRIMAVDAAARIVTIEGRPTLTGPDHSWQIRRRPRLVVLDPVGERPRLSGAGARPGTAPDQVLLDGDASLSLVNINFDTVYLANDVARPSRTYRIIGCDAQARTLTLDGEPALDGEVSPWQLPAGAGGRYTPEPAFFSPKARGTNHYEGAVYIVYDGALRGSPSFTSYSSWSWTGGNADQRSAIRGNARYDCVSWLSGDTWKNYSFQIRSAPDPNPHPDHVVRARYYFDNMSNPRPPAGNPGGVWNPLPPLLYVQDDVGGKQLIRFHDGHTGGPGDAAAGSTGSAGCVVSPQHHPFRALLIGLHQQERALLNTPPNPDVALQNLAAAATRDDAQDLYQRSFPPAPPPPPAPAPPPPPPPHVREADWVGKLAMRMWLVRPDERPAGPAAL
jgi:hypothetical protein